MYLHFQLSIGLNGVAEPESVRKQAHTWNIYVLVVLFVSIDLFVDIQMFQSLLSIYTRPSDLGFMVLCVMIVYASNVHDESRR